MIPRGEHLHFTHVSLATPQLDRPVQRACALPRTNSPSHSALASIKVQRLRIATFVRLVTAALPGATLPVGGCRLITNNMI
ncbi:hypothetical protein E2C01_012541 [Portunus trituberculatus]|uniref:Uncharacterized protein n=1 Tax=Portunus trituberculatus TaxID=210409 RepID=A0A5B7DE09_PORTR|nr:hypothetical protein [Portunus trituberculatus]